MPKHRTELLRIARAAITSAFATGREMQVDLESAAPELCALAATFVTLRRNHQLRGCIGTLEAQRPLLQDVASNAYAAAFKDPRFTPLTEQELDDLTISLSLLSTPEPLTVESEQELLNKLVPGRDGLIVREGTRRATFLPTVWEELPEPDRFLAHLKAKAGLPPDYWSDTLRFERYFSDSWSEAENKPSQA